MYSIPKGFSKKRRGIASVVTAALLISTVAIMGVALTGWANMNLYTKQATLESSFNEKMNKLNEDLLVEHIWFGTNPNVVNVTMNNVGSIGLNVTKIEIKNSTDVLYLTITDGGISPNGDLSVQDTFAWNADETTDFSIFTNRGNIFTAQKVT